MTTSPLKDNAIEGFLNKARESDFIRQDIDSIIRAVVDGQAKRARDMYAQYMNTNSKQDATHV